MDQVSFILACPAQLFNARAIKTEKISLLKVEGSVFGNFVII